MFGVLLTLASALVDSKAIVAASRVWRAGRVSWPAVGWSAAWFFLGFFVYLAALRFLSEAGLTQATLQLLCWFGATIIGVAVISGDVSNWPTARITVSVVAVLALAYVLVDGAHTTA